LGERFASGVLKLSAVLPDEEKLKGKGMVE
jgi:hypothetical protein